MNIALVSSLVIITKNIIGTAHLANKQMKYLYSNQPSLKAEFEDDAEKIQRNVLLAGLCHDLGHGPFSHTFDNLIIKKIRFKIIMVK